MILIPLDNICPTNTQPEKNDDKKILISRIERPDLYSKSFRRTNT